jgi:YbbR domain-containing protein
VSGHEIERRIWVPVSYSNVPDSFKIGASQVDTVSVYVRGADNRVSSLTEGDIRVIVSLDNAAAGANEIRLQPDDVIVPLGVHVFQIDPSNLTVQLERSQQKNVIIRATVDGTPPPGMAIGAISLKPEIVTLEGPESVFRGQVVAVTSRIDVTGRRSTFSQDVEVRTTHPDLRVVQPRTVRATVQIVPASSLRSPEGQ